MVDSIRPIKYSIIPLLINHEYQREQKGKREGDYQPERKCHGGKREKSAVISKFCWSQLSRSGGCSPINRMQEKDTAGNRMQNQEKAGEGNAEFSFGSDELAPDLGHPGRDCGKSLLSDSMGRQKSVSRNGTFTY